MKRPNTLGPNIMLICAMMMAFGTIQLAGAADKSDKALATFAGGCFWCMEAPFDVLPGVLSTTSGYTGGAKVNPTYEEVSAGQTGHAESVQIEYDPDEITYEKLLEVFWHNIDPTQLNGQFCDHGPQYRSAIFCHDKAQYAAAVASKEEVEKRFDEKIYTAVMEAKPFYRAEDYHQDFYKKNPSHYERYRKGCGRDARLKQLWGDDAGHTP